MTSASGPGEKQKLQQGGRLCIWWSLYLGRSQRALRMNLATLPKRLRRRETPGLAPVTELAAPPGKLRHGAAARGPRGGREGWRNGGEHLVQRGGDEGQEQQPPQRAAHDERQGVGDLEQLHFGLCLGEKGETSGETTPDIWGFPIHTVCTPESSGEPLLKSPRIPALSPPPPPLLPPLPPPSVSLSSIFLSFCLSLSLYLHLSLPLSRSVSVSVSISICLYLHLSLSLSLSLSFVSVSVSVAPSVSISLSLSLYVCLSPYVSLLLCLSLPLSLCLPLPSPRDLHKPGPSPSNSSSASKTGTWALTNAPCPGSRVNVELLNMISAVLTTRRWLCEVCGRERVCTAPGP